MSSVNRVILVGRLGKDPELRYTQNGQAVANFSLATSESWESDGKKQERTEWHRCVAWGRLAEVVAQYLPKGSLAYFEGKLQTRQWEDREGQKRFTTEIVVAHCQFLDTKKRKGGDEAGVTGRPRRTSKPPEQPAEHDDGIPF